MFVTLTSTSLQPISNMANSSISKFPTPKSPTQPLCQKSKNKTKPKPKIKTKMQTKQSLPSQLNNLLTHTSSLSIQP